MNSPGPIRAPGWISMPDEAPHMGDKASECEPSTDPQPMRCTMEAQGVHPRVAPYHLDDTPCGRISSNATWISCFNVANISVFPYSWAASCSAKLRENRIPGREYADHLAFDQRLHGQTDDLQFPIVHSPWNWRWASLQVVSLTCNRCRTQVDSAYSRPGMRFSPQFAGAACAQE